jgi:hypothetical protein
MCSDVGDFSRCLGPTLAEEDPLEPTLVEARMGFHRVCFGLALAVVLTGCSAPDPGAVHPGPPRELVNGATQAGGAGASDAGGGIAIVDSGSGVRADAGDGGFDLFATAPAQPPTERAAQVADHAAQPLTPTTDCRSCHRNGGTGTDWVFAGYAVQPAAGTGKAGIDVCVANYPGDGGAPQLVGCTKTDQDGYYWLAAGAVAIGPTSIPSVRYNGIVTSMPESPGANPPQYGGGDCNAGGACHGGAQGRVHAQ